MIKNKKVKQKYKKSRIRELKISRLMLIVSKIILFFGGAAKDAGSVSFFHQWRQKKDFCYYRIWSKDSLSPVCMIFFGYVY